MIFLFNFQQCDRLFYISISVLIHSFSGDNYEYFSFSILHHVHFLGSILFQETITLLHMSHLLCALSVRFQESNTHVISTIIEMKKPWHKSSNKNNFSSYAEVQN